LDLLKNLFLLEEIIKKKSRGGLTYDRYRCSTMF
jgi:hypothetical protein